MFRWLRRLVGLDFHDIRPAGLSFRSGEDFFWHEIGCGMSDVVQPECPTLALIEGILPDAATLGLAGAETAHLNIRHYSIRIGVANGHLRAIGYTINASPDLAVGDIAIFLPTTSHRGEDGWVGPLVTELHPSYSDAGYVPLRSLI